MLTKIYFKMFTLTSQVTNVTGNVCNNYTTTLINQYIVSDKILLQIY